MSQRVSISVTNDLECDQRVQRVCDTLLQKDYKIELIGRVRKESKRFVRPYKTKRFKLFFSKGLAFYGEYNLRLFFYLLSNKSDILYANDLDSLLPNYLISRIFSIPLIYDSHEYFTEVPELIDRPVVRSFWLTLEKAIFPKLKNNITVNSRLAQEYAKKYKVSVNVVRNVPIKGNNCSEGFRKNPKDERLLVYQGSLNIGRGIELMIDTMTLLQEFTLIIVGSGDIEEKLKIKVNSLKLNDHVHFKGRISPEQLPALTREACIGLSLEEDLGLNYRYALPNKVFDYIHAGIPTIVSDLPVMGTFVRENKIGEVLTQRDPKSLALLVKSVFENREKYSQHIGASVEKYNWQNEKKEFLRIVENLE